MGWAFTDDADRYHAAVWELLSAEPERHTIALTVLEQLRSGRRWSADPIILGWCAEGSTTEAAILMTPPFPLVLAGVDTSGIDELIRALRVHQVQLPGINAERAVADAFATAWVEVTGARHQLQMEERLYRLDELIVPSRRARGQARPASHDDLDLLVEWAHTFEIEARTIATSTQQKRSNAAQMIDEGRCWLWVDGVPVAMAGRSPTVAGVARVGPVYTPTGHRGRGYGSEVTAACTRDALATGAEGVVLFTDLANPTSNAIYQTIGYRPVADRLVITFSDPPGPAPR